MSGPADPTEGTSADHSRSGHDIAEAIEVAERGSAVRGGARPGHRERRPARRRSSDRRRPRDDRGAGRATAGRLGADDAGHDRPETEQRGRRAGRCRRPRYRTVRAAGEQP